MSALDGLALGWFLVIWLSYDWAVSGSRWRTHSVSYLMNQQRAAWIEQACGRGLRMVDAQVISGLQNGTAFFASTALLAIGGGLAALNASGQIQVVADDLGLSQYNGPRQVELKLLGVTVLFVYAFLKFGWAFRLFNYASILIGAIPQIEGLTADEDPTAQKTIRMLQAAGGEFNRGLRALFLAIAALGWFAGPVAFILTTTAMIALLIQRQFFSGAKQALLADRIDGANR